MFSTTPAWRSHGRFPSSSVFSLTTRLALPIWKSRAGTAGSFARTVRWAESRSALITALASCVAGNVARILG